MVKDINGQNFEKEVLKSEKPVLMDVYAKWCGPCQMMLPIFEDVAKELSDKCKFVKVNVDEAREIAIQFGITSVPTFVFMKNGEVVNKQMGYMDKEELKAKIREFLV